MITTDLLLRAGEESVKFIDSMRSDELGIYTLRKAFEMGYLHGANAILEEQADDDGELYIKKGDHNEWWPF